MSEELRYKWADISVKEYASDLDEFWRDLQDPDSDLSQDAKEFGIELEQVRQLKREEAIEVRLDGEGSDPATIAVIIALAPVAAKAIDLLKPIIHDLWRHIFLPRILQRRGGNALTPKE